MDNLEPRIGVMQGRLLPSEDGRIQGFPNKNWGREFALAERLGLDFLEWIYEEPNSKDNPLMRPGGRAKIRELSKKASCPIHTVCADYFMEERLLDHDREWQTGLLAHLELLVGHISQIGANAVLLPFVDSSSAAAAGGADALITLLERIAPIAARYSIEIHLELDLAPEQLSYLLTRVSDSNVKMVFDMGNSASLGFDPDKELRAISGRIGGVHVKDRKLHGSTVPLGQGNVDFDLVFSRLASMGYDRTLTLQAARVEDIGEISLAQKNIGFVTSLIDKYYRGR